MGLLTSDHPITLNSVVSTSSDQVSLELAGEVVILHLKAGIYYGLDTVGARVWDLIQEPTPVSHIRDALLEEFAVDPRTCEREVMALLRELAGMELIEIRNEKAD